MPRAGGVYSAPAGTTATSGTTIESAKYNALVADLVTDANAARPVTAGGTGETSARLDDGVWKFKNTSDATKLLALDLSGLTTATTRTLTAPDANGTLALTSDVSKGGSPVNLGLVASVASSALTVSIKGFDGNDPSASNPVYIPFRSATATSGDVDVLTLTAATSIVVSNGSTLGTTSGVASTLAIVAFNDAGTIRLGIINPTGSAVVAGIASSTAEGGAGGADSAAVFYTGTAVTSKAYAVLGYLTATEATAGVWATAPSLVQPGSLDAAVKTLPIKVSFTSAEQAITSGGALTLAHSLGAVPKAVQLYLVCQTAEQGYTVGQTVQIQPGVHSSTTDQGIAIVTDGTNVYIRFGSAASAALKIINFTAGTSNNATNANWKLVVRAFT